MIAITILIITELSFLNFGVGDQQGIIQIYEI